MKKLTTLVLAAGLVVSSFAGASAGEFRPNAQFINQFEGVNGGRVLTDGFGTAGTTEHFGALMRLRLGFDYIASETLSGTFLTQMGPYAYGNAALNMGGAYSFDSYLENIRVRLAYVDWVIPTTPVKVRMGFQPVAMPSLAFGSAVLDTRATGVSIASPITDEISMSFMWTRASSDDDGGTNPALVGATGDDADIFSLTADFNYDGFRITPWAMYSMIGRGSSIMTNPTSSLDSFGFDTNAWWLGASFELSMFDPFRFAIDAYYSSVSWDDPADTDMSGFFVGAVASYATDWGTPALKGWYASGDDNTIGNAELGRPAALAGFFNATSIMFSDQVIWRSGLSNQTWANPAGTAGVVLEWAGLSFVENLDHTFRVAYIMGTNDFGDGNFTSNADLQYLSTEDSVIEVNFNTTYQIYKNLSTTLELGYLMADFDVNSNLFQNNEDDDIMRSALSFTYSF